MPTSSVLFETIKKCGGWEWRIAPPHLGSMDARGASFNDLKYHVACNLHPLSLSATSTPSPILTMNNTEIAHNCFSCFAFPLRPAQFCTWIAIPNIAMRNQTTFLTVAA